MIDSRLGGLSLQQSVGARRAEVPVRYFLVTAALTGVVLRFATLGRQSLWVDEVITLKNSYVGEPGIMQSFFRTLQGPLASLVMHFWAGIGGGDAFLHVPFAIVGALTVLALYWLGRSLFDSWTAIHTAFVASLSPILIWYSQEIRGYAFALLFVVLMTRFFVEWMARPGARNAFFYGVCLLAGLLSNLSVAFVAAAQFAYLVVVQGKRRLIGRWLVAVFLVLLVFSPWVREMIERWRSVPGATASTQVVTGGGGLSAFSIPYVYFVYGGGYSLGPTVRELQADSSRAVNENVGWILAAAAVFGLPLVLGMVRLARSNSNLLTLLLLWMAVPVVCVSLVAGLGLKTFNVRYALVGVPAFILLTASGLAAITRTRFWPFLGVYAALVGFAIYNYVAVPSYGKEDAKQAAAIVSSNLRDGDVVVGVYTAEPLEYYLRGTAAVNVFGADDLVSAATMSARCEAMSRGADRVWLSLCRQRAVDPRGTIKSWFDSNLTRVNAWELPGIELCLYQKKGMD